MPRCHTGLVYLFVLTKSNSFLCEGGRSRLLIKVSEDGPGDPFLLHFSRQLLLLVKFSAGRDSPRTADHNEREIRVHVRVPKLRQTDSTGEITDVNCRVWQVRDNELNGENRGQMYS